MNRILIPSLSVILAACAPVEVPPEPVFVLPPQPPETFRSGYVDVPDGPSTVSARRPAARPNTKDVPIAERVPARPGFVFAPGTNRTEQIDVTGVLPGEHARDPKTGIVFIVPVNINEVFE